MSMIKPNIILSSFARSGASAIDLALRPILESIGYYVTPFGIEGSPKIVDDIDGVHDPFFHFTHAPPSLFQPLLDKDNYRFVYQYRDPRDSVSSWAYNEISEGNIEGDIDDVRTKIIMSRHSLTEHVTRAREWFALGARVHRLTFEEMKADKAAAIAKILDFATILPLIDPKVIEESLAEFSDQRYTDSLKVKEARLFEQGLVRAKRGKSSTWVDTFTPADKMLFKKIAGDFLIELGYEDDFNW